MLQNGVFSSFKLYKSILNVFFGLLALTNGKCSAKSTINTLRHAISIHNYSQKPKSPTIGLKSIRIKQSILIDCFLIRNLIRIRLKASHFNRFLITKKSNKIGFSRSFFTQGVSKSHKSVLRVVHCLYLLFVDARIPKKRSAALACP